MSYKRAEIRNRKLRKMLTEQGDKHLPRGVYYDEEKGRVIFYSRVSCSKEWKKILNRKVRRKINEKISNRFYVKLNGGDDWKWKTD